MTPIVQRDEREAAIDNAADRLAFLVVCYCALALAAYRSIVLGQAAWDLLGLVVLGGLIGLGYRIRQRATGRSWMAVLAATVVVAAVIAVVASALGVER